MRLLKSLHRAKAGRNKYYEDHGGQYHSPTVILWPHTVLFRSVGSTITPTHIRSLFCGSKIETIETYNFLKWTTETVPRVRPLVAPCMNAGAGSAQVLPVLSLREP